MHPLTPHHPALPQYKRLTAFRLAATVVLLSTLSLPARADAPTITPHHPGVWSSDVRWGATQVHMILVPGTGSFHSRILWWQHGHDDFKFGGLRGWNPPAGTYDCGSFPTGSFVDIHLGGPGVDIFCAGHAHLEDGRVFIAGGTAPNSENGITATRFFDPLTLTWSNGPDMSARRWYPNVTQLGTGDALISSGSQYPPFHMFGGLKTSETAPSDDAIHRYAIVGSEGEWETSIERPGSGQWPSALEGHTMINHPAGQQFVFGGRDSLGNLQDKVHRLGRSANDFGPDYSYTWTNVGSPPSRPDPRTEHVAVAMKSSGSSLMFVFGGRTSVGAVGEVWKLTPGSPNWSWSEVFPSGSDDPGPLESHAAVYDSVGKRMLVFGGRSSSSGNPDSNAVWALEFSNDFSTATWVRPTVTGTPPSARYDHTFGWSAGLASGARRNGYDYAMLFGGTDASGNLLNDLWTLWIKRSDGSLEWEQNTVSGDLPSPRTAHAVGMIGGTEGMLIHGGKSGGGVVDDTVYVAALGAYGDTTVWNATDQQPGARKNHAGLITESLLVYARQSERFDFAEGDLDTIAGYKVQDWYPQTFQVPDGIFVAGPDLKSYYYDPAASTPWDPYPGDGSTGFAGGAAVQYLPGQIMKAGSRDTDQQGSPAIRTTISIDLNPIGPADTLWRGSKPMSVGRVNHNMTVLPSGEVLVTGGTGVVNNRQAVDPRTRPELWRPVAWQASGQDSFGVWYGNSGTDTLTASGLKRDYHSTALLLPDGRVLVGGGNAQVGSAVEDTLIRRRVEVYCPPYLFLANGNLATRPVIDAAPVAANYAEVFDVESADAQDITKVCLIKPGATTHGQDQDQRYVPLSFTKDADTLRVTSPASPDSAPPGDYLLFILTEHPDDTTQVVPSIASWIRLSTDVIAPAKRNLTADLVSQTSVGLEWTAPGDDDTTGIAQEYDVRWSTAPIDDEDSWNAASKPSGEPVPLSPGTEQGYQVTGLASCTTYWFALKTRDEAYNHAAISDQISAKTTCGGGGGLGESVHEIAGDEGGVGVRGGAASTAAATLAGSGRGATATSLKPVPLNLVAEFEATGGGMTMTLTRTSGSIAGLGATDTSGIILQLADGSGGWVTRNRFLPSMQDGLFGLKPSESRFRYVCLGDYDLTHVAASTAANGDVQAMTAATHSQLGDVTALVEAQGYAPLADGNALTITYATGTASSEDLDWFVLVNRSGSAGSTTWRRDTPQPASVRPVAFALHQNQPNPFSGATTIRFDLPVATTVKLEVFDLLGRRIRTLANAPFTPGFHAIDWDQRDSRGNLLRAGVFMYRIQAAEFGAQRKMVIVP